MQPKALKERSKSALAARAKVLYTADLEWLEGFPLAVEAGSVRWMAVPAGSAAQELCIERQHLSRTTYALNKLRIELATVLDRLADEPETWLASVERRLELLKGAIHQGVPLPQHLYEESLLSRARREQAAALAKAEPRLRALLDALSWIHAGHPDRIQAALDSLATFSPGPVRLAERLGELPALISSLSLLQLASAHGAGRVRALAECLFDERTHDVALNHGPAFCAQILGAINKQPKNPLPEDLPAGSLGRDLAAWCASLVPLNRRAQRWILRLFELATPLPLVEQWAHWWDTARQRLRDAREISARPYERKSRQRLRTELEKLRRSAPPVLPIADFLGALQEQAASPESGRSGHFERALERIPAKAAAPGRTQLFIYWTFLPDGGAPPAKIQTLLDGFTRYLTRKPVEDAALLRPWREIATTPRGWDAPEVDLLDGDRPKRTILAAYDHLASVAALHGGLEPDPAQRAVELFLLAGDSPLAAALFDSLRAKNRLDRYYSKPASELALRLCRDRPERFADVVKALDDQEDQTELSPTDWPEAVIGPLSSGDLGDFVRESIATRQWSRLLVCATKATLLAVEGEVPPPQPADADDATLEWMRRYPPPLQPVLRRLAGTLDDAEAKVARWLADDFPDAARLHQEIAALGLRLEHTDEARQTALRTRLANLQSRLARPSVPSTARLERVVAKLDRAWGRALLDRWERELDFNLPAALHRLLGIDEVPPWLRESKNLSLLAAAAQLKRGHRPLALRLFRLRCGPPPWDLRDAPQNRRFLASLPAIDWRPWIGGVGIVAVTAANGRPLYLALEDDPLEIFRMGAHFKTCLSPGAMNYFSVFANAADINKRVLYARDGDGRVVGRCLLALTAQGELLTFEPYCHDRNAGFPKVCGDFADQLAGRMHTRRIARGTVPVLVASQWYDDGPRDLGRRFLCLDDGSPLRERLATVRPGEVLGELRRALKPARLDETTLPLILKLPELARRPELAVPLLHRIAECRSLPADSLITAAFLGLRGGSGDLVQRLFLQRLVQDLRRSFRILGWADPRAVEVLLQLDPARVLAVLRQTRLKTVHHWMEESDGVRLQVAAAAHDALHRPRQARELWRRLAHDPAVRTNEEQRRLARMALGE